MEPRCRRVPTARGRPRRAAGTHEPSGCGGAARGVTPTGCAALGVLGPRGAGHTSRRCGPGRGRAARPPPVPRTARGWPTPPRAPRCRPGRGATRPGPGAPWAPGAWGGRAGDGGWRSPTQPPKRWPSAGRLATRRGGGPTSAPAAGGRAMGPWGQRLVPPVPVSCPAHALRGVVGGGAPGSPGRTALCPGERHPGSGVCTVPTAATGNARMTECSPVTIFGLKGRAITVLYSPHQTARREVISTMRRKARLCS